MTETSARRLIIRRLLLVVFLGSAIAFITTKACRRQKHPPFATLLAQDAEVARFFIDLYSEDLTLVLSLLRDTKVIGDFSINSTKRGADVSLYVIDIAGFIKTFNIDCTTLSSSATVAVLACASRQTCVAAGDNLIICDSHFMAYLNDIAVARFRMEGKYDILDLGHRSLLGRTRSEASNRASLLSTMPASQRPKWQAIWGGVVFPILAHEVGHLKNGSTSDVHMFDARVGGFTANARPIDDGHSYHVQLELNCTKLRDAVCVRSSEEEQNADLFAARAIKTFSDTRSMDKSFEHEFLLAASLYPIQRALYSELLAEELSTKKPKYQKGFCTNGSKAIGRNDLLTAALAANDVHAHWAHAADQAMEILLANSRDMTEFERRLYLTRREILACMQKLAVTVCNRPVTEWCSDAQISHAWPYVAMLTDDIALNAAISDLEWWLGQSPQNNTIRGCVWELNPFKPNRKTKKCYEQSRETNDTTATRVLARLLIATEPVLDPTVERPSQDVDSQWYYIKRMNYWREHLGPTFNCPRSIQSLADIHLCSKKGADSLDGHESFVFAESRIADKMNDLQLQLCPHTDYQKCMDYLADTGRVVAEYTGLLLDETDLSISQFDRSVAYIYWMRTLAVSLQQHRRLSGIASRIWSMLYNIADDFGWYQLRYEAARAAYHSGALASTDRDKVNTLIERYNQAENDWVELRTAIGRK